MYWAIWHSAQRLEQAQNMAHRGWQWPDAYFFNQAVFQVSVLVSLATQGN